MGGGIERGTICKKELEEAGEIRVSIRPPKFLGSTELFTLRHLEPADYHLILIAIPRKKGSGQFRDKGNSLEHAKGGVTM